MRDRIIVILVFILMSCMINPQAFSYEVERGSQANKLVLSIRNPVSGEQLEGVSVSLAHAPGWVLNFSPDPYILDDIGIDEERRIIFSFDIKEGIDGFLDDTLVLKISAAGGGEWMTEIQLETSDSAPQIQVAPATLCCVDDTPPTHVELSSFNARALANHIVIEWSTATEMDNAGFNLYRSEGIDDAMTLISENLIPSQGSELEGATYSCVDENVVPEVTYYYWLENVHLNGRAEMFGPVSTVMNDPGTSEDIPVPHLFCLHQNYPNPFNPTTFIQYDLPHTCRVRLEIFNVHGQRVATIVDSHQQAGSKTACWNGKNDKGTAVSGGIYFYRLQAGSFKDIKKMVLLR